MRCNAIRPSPPGRDLRRRRARGAGPGRAGRGGAARPRRVAVGDLRGQHGRRAAARLLRRPPPRPSRGQPRPPLPHHRDLRHADHLLDHAARAVRDGRRRVISVSPPAYVAATLAAGFVFVRLGIAWSAAPEVAPVSADAAAWIAVGLLGGARGRGPLPDRHDGHRARRPPLPARHPRDQHRRRAGAGPGRRRGAGRRRRW